MAPNSPPVEASRLTRSAASILALCALVGCGRAEEPAVEADASVASSSPSDPRGAGTAGALTLEPVDVGTDALLQAVSAPSSDIVWLSGHDGTWARSVDGGATWATAVVTDYEDFQFRDVHGFTAQHAVLMSAGPGEASRILRTADGGTTWTETFRMDHPEGFLDCMDFWDVERGLAYGDAVDGGLYLLVTGDGGRSWERIPPDRLPPALEGEGGFAASGSCVDAGSGGRAWVVTGNARESRMLVTEDYGASWSSSSLPLAAGAGRGATTVGFRPDGMGFALGGDLDPEGEGARVALSPDRGTSWSAVGDLTLAGAVYGAAWAPGLDAATVVAVGPGGLDFSLDGGMRWIGADTVPYWAVGFSGPTRGWAVGPEGRVSRIVVRP